MNLWREHPVLSAAVALLVVGVAAVLWRLRQRLMRSEYERRRAAEELNRRLSELFSLQELSYVLSDSLELDRIVEQVVRYAVRFLDAQGALLALVGETAGDPLQIAAAKPQPSGGCKRHWLTPRLVRWFHLPERRFRGVSPLPIDIFR